PSPSPSLRPPDARGSDAPYLGPGVPSDATCRGRHHRALARGRGSVREWPRGAQPEGRAQREEVERGRGGDLRLAGRRARQGQWAVGLARASFAAPTGAGRARRASNRRWRSRAPQSRTLEKSGWSSFGRARGPCRQTP
uniref:Uncharacterized protein n=1 Tax=Castor canadensis TaxID=51338 RepID=A0A8C0X9Z9_CASCN